MLHKIRWTAKKIAQRLNLIEALVYRRRQSLTNFRYLKLDGPLADPPVGPDIDDTAWAVIQPGDYWGGRCLDFVLRTQFQIPAEWDNEAQIALHLPLGVAGDFSHPEALAYIDGVPLAACDRHHQEILLPLHCVAGQTYSLALHGWVGLMEKAGLGVSDWGGPLRGDPDAKLLMRQCAVVQIDQPTRDFIALSRVALGIANNLNENEPAQAHLYNALDEAFKTLDTREPFDDRFYASVSAAYRILRAGVERSGAALDVDITAVGHAHLDVAWLWTLNQTRRKAGRTFHNVLRLMEQFPTFHFTQSQPQLYDYARQDYPDLFKAIKSRVAEGRWEVIGGMWVEADCNLSGGESLVRQFLLGRRFFRRHFGEGVESPVLWLPDVFGYAWNLPQLIKEAGLEYFFTIKIGWNETNRLPYDSFWWQGLDGTRVLTHFSPTHESGAYASTYNAKASPAEAMSTWTNFQQKDWGKPGVTPPLLMSFGYGDGGGGPTREMLENIREMADFPAAPRIRSGTAAEFFRNLETRVGDRLPIWNGELYLENHRGTYTTQARNKRANRKSEFLLHDVEFLAAIADLLHADYRYPHHDLQGLWELVCLNQFHDIIPGSSIGEVYVESQQQYAEVQSAGERLKQEALATIAERVGGDVIVVNPTSFTRNDLAFYLDPAHQAICPQRPDGSSVRRQPVDGGWLLDVGNLPPYSVTPLITGDDATPQDKTNSLFVTPNLLENGFLRVEFDSAGEITRIFDKQNGREVLPSGAIANQLQLFEDRPKNPDAWDIDIFFDDKMWLAEPANLVRVVESGSLRTALEIRRRILSSEIRQHISLAHNSPRLDFDTSVQWRERHILLKVAFPVEVLSPQATYEIQWGNVQRPTHRNTSWDWARFETAAQKWVDLSEGDYGVSLLNDCKYGHDIHDNVIRLSLLRSPTNPDPEADLGEHRFAYSLFPHSGRWDERTIAQAYALNDPLIVWGQRDNASQQSGGGSQRSFFAVDQPNVVIETIKQAEDGQGLIVRLYESQRQRGQFTLTAGFPISEAWRTNLLEENQEQVAVDGRQAQVSINPYQIVTLRLLPASPYSTLLS